MADRCGHLHPGSWGEETCERQGSARETCSLTAGLQAGGLATHSVSGLGRKNIEAEYGDLSSGSALAVPSPHNGAQQIISPFFEPENKCLGEDVKSYLTGVYKVDLTFFNFFKIY